jgi:hypothetical protein
MRQRTKVAEWWERRQVLRDGARVDITTFKDEASARRAKKRGTLHHVTRYRLAPLVRLWWVWRKSGGLAAMTDDDVTMAVVFVVSDIDPNALWLWWAGPDQYNTEASLAEAKAACAARLRELGYLLVDE